MFEGYEKITSIMRIQELNLPTPKTVFVSDVESQNEELNNFLKGKDFVIIRSDKVGQASHCPSNIKCDSSNAESFISDLNKQGYAAIVQNHVPLNNRFSGNVLILSDCYIIEVMRGGPVSKLNREGVVHEHLRINKNGSLLFHYGERVIPEEDIKRVISRVQGLNLNYHILEFSSGPDWFYYWHIRKDDTSRLLEK
ncbi:MAG: hypothetical protein JW791_00570 [Nanoarchaeota archaeon]|nr:hypothetical protein [Nanoarchaeota archaeon]